MDMMEMMDDQDGRDVFFFFPPSPLPISVSLSVCLLDSLLNLSLPRHGPIIRIERLQCGVASSGCCVNCRYVSICIATVNRTV